MRDTTQIIERLAKVETKLDTVIKGHENHLRHHWAVNLTLIAALITESVGLLFLIIKSHIL